MRKIIFKPEVLFLIGTLCGLFPYAVYAFVEKPQYLPEFNYQPAMIYVIGYACFFAGARLASIKSHRTIKLNLPPIDTALLTRLIQIVTFLLLVQNVLAIVFVYGEIPILSYLQKRNDVNDVNVMQEKSGFGQLGVFTLTIMLLGSMIILWTIIFVTRHGQSRVPIKITVAVAILLLSSSLAGKRQSQVMFMVALFTGLSFLPQSSLRTLANLSGMRLLGTRRIRFLLLILAPIGAIGFMGAMAILRSGSERSGIDETMGYLSYPLANMELQCSYSEWGPGTSQWDGAFQTLLPYKLIGQMDKPPLAVTGSPSTFYSPLHWYWGILGITLFTVLVGYLTKYLYVRAHTSVVAFMCYCQLAWALLACHTYNHFLNLIFLPMPLMCYLILGRVLTRYRARGRFLAGVSVLPSLTNEDNG